MISSQRGNLISVKYKFNGSKLDQLDDFLPEAEILERRALKGFGPQDIWKASP
jgi:hypothetical protein